MVQMSQT
jgi:hypothetical protein